VKKLIIAIAAASLSGPVILPVAAQQHSTDQTVANLDMAAVPDLDGGGVRAVQAALRNKGFDPGSIDGVAGPMTKEAVRTFQSRYGMKPTGVVDNQSLFALGEADLAISSAR
jgi:peptidoglycan hydrolase-like protein with peptidoglycan-binding domain